MHLPQSDSHLDLAAPTVAALILEPLGSIICGRSEADIAERSQVISPQKIDPSGSIISAATVVCEESWRGSISLLAF
jgi:hypothetical protein